MQNTTTPTPPEPVEMTRTMFSQIVEHHRKNRGDSLRDFAEYLSEKLTVAISHETIRNWENDTYQPKHYRFLAFLNAYPHKGDIRRRFAYDCMAALDPEYVAPASAFAKNLLSDQTSSVVPQTSSVEAPVGSTPTGVRE